MSRYACKGLATLLLALLVASPVAAEDYTPPYSLRVVPPTEDPVPGQPTELEIVFQAERSLQLSRVALTGKGWQVANIGVSGTKTVPSAGETTLRFRVTPDASWQPLQLEFMVDGEVYRKSVDLAPLEVRLQRVGGALTASDKPSFLGYRAGRVADPPGTKPGPVPLSMLPSHLAGDPDAYTPPTDKSVHTVTATGTIGHSRNGRYHPAFALTVIVYLETGMFKVPLGTTTTNRDGSFSISFQATVGVPINLSLSAVAANDAMRVMIESYIWEDVYYWTGMNVYGFTGTNQDWGLLETEGMVGAQSIINSISRANVMLYTNTGLSGIDWVDIWWPIYEGVSHYTRTGTWNTVPDIYFRDTSTWRSDTHCHEYGHHFVNTYAQSPVPDYCNPGGYCDNGDCGHCGWCAENINTAFTEGFPHWVGDVVTNDWYANEQDSSPLRRSSWKRALKCIADGTITDPWLTEGAFAALLHDMTSVEADNDTTYFFYEDNLTVPYSQILDTVMFDEPTSPREFINDFRARHPEHDALFWDACGNNGFTGLDLTPPTPGSISSPSHPVNTDRSAASITVQFNNYTDDFSGLAGYAVKVNANTPAAPGYAINAGTAVNRTVFGPYAAGTYYVTVRAFDNAENFTNSYQTYGPVVIREPIAADLVPDPWTADWAYPLVPKDTQVAIEQIVPADTNLILRTMYWNACFTNTGEVATPNQRTGILLDDVEVAHYDGWLPGWGDHLVRYNQGPITVPGGRHTFELDVDRYSSVAETNEANNRWAKQWTWFPTTLNEGYNYNSDGAPLRTAGWDYCVGTRWYNADGYRIVTAPGVAPSTWAAVWVKASHRTKDIDVRIHDATTGADSGFAANIGASYRPAGYLDAVLVNAGNRPAAIYDIGILTGSAEEEPVGYKTAVAYGQELSEGVPLATTLTSQYGLDLYTFSAEPNTDYYVTLERDWLSYDEPLRVSWYGHDFTTGDLLDHLATAVADTMLDTYLTVTTTNTTTATCAIAVWRDFRDNNYEAQNYTITVRRSPPDLVPAVPSGWAAPAVPRATAGATGSWAPEPTVLVGDAAATYFNYAVGNTGSNATSTFRVSHRIDGLANLLFFHGGLLPGGVQTYLSSGGLPVRGGRHTLSLVVDLDDAVDELSEFNNGFATQYVWRPSNLVFGNLTTRPAPPPRTSDWELVEADDALWYNCDAKRTPTWKPSGTSKYWGAVAVVPGPNSDVDLRLHYWSTGARNGFDLPLAVSSWSRGQSDFLIMNFRNTGLKYYDVGVVEGAPNSTESYHITVAESVGLPANPDGVVGTYTISASELIKLYEINFTDPGQYIARLTVADPAVDLGFSLYSPSLILGAKSDAKDGTAAAWTATGGAADIFEFSVLPDSTGLHGLAVWKVGAADVPLTTDFTLTIEHTGISDVPTEALPVATRLVGTYPNPFNPQTTVVFELDQPGPARLRIYDVSGHLVRVLAGEVVLPAGRHEVVWNGRDESGRQVATGVYFCRFETNGIVQTGRMALVK